MTNFSVPFFSSILHRVAIRDRICNDYDVCVWVWQRPKSFVRFLTGCVPKAQTNFFVADKYWSYLGVKHRRYVVRTKLVSSEACQKTSLTTEAIPNNDDLFLDGMVLTHRGRRWVDVRTPPFVSMLSGPSVHVTGRLRGVMASPKGPAKPPFCGVLTVSLCPVIFCFLPQKARCDY